jgi:ABC-type glycerol-3-phosphate transport system substrate-binding protein
MAQLLPEFNKLHPDIKINMIFLGTLEAGGEADPVSFGFTECLNLFSQERAAMWYDATSAAGSVESSDSKVAGKVGYVRAPVKETEDSGWLWSWNLGINAESDTKEQAWEFLKWATSKEYAKLVGSPSAGPRLLRERASPPTRSLSTSRLAVSSRR